MAICLECHNPMKQTEAICPHCGEDFLEPQPDRWNLLLHKSSLSDLFRLTGVMGIFFAFVPLLVSLQTSALWPFYLGIVCGGCVLLLGETAPLWSRVLSIIGILAFLLYPLLAVLILIWMLFRRMTF